MSTDGLSPRKMIFDSVFFLYSVALAAYLILQAGFELGLTDFTLTQDIFIARFSFFASAGGIAAVLTTALAAGADRMGLRTLGDVLFATPVQKQEIQTAPKRWALWRLHLITVLILTLILSWNVTEASMGELLDAKGLQGAWRLWTGLTQPNLSLLPRAIALAVETIFIAFLSTVLAIPAAFFLAFFASKNIMSTGPAALGAYSVLRLILNITRSVEPLIWALIFTVWVGVGPFAGMLALTIHSVASLIKYYSEIVESVSEGPIDGVRSTGANEVQVIWYAIVPQVILPYIAMTVYRWDTNVRMATVIGLVGGGGIGTLLIQYQGQAMWPEVGCIILVIAVIVWLMDTASAYIREALR